MAHFELNVNGRDVTADVDDPAMPLLYFLRNELGLRGPRFGCGLGQCGACTVLIDGVAVRSCIYTMQAVQGKVVTLEGLGTPDKPHPLQKAFIDEQAVQCGYCINGMIMQAGVAPSGAPRRIPPKTRSNQPCVPTCAVVERTCALCAP